MRSLLLRVCRLAALGLLSWPMCFGQSQSVLSPAEQYQRIGRLIAQKNYGEAIDKCKALIERGSEDEHVYEKLVQAATDFGKQSEARVWLQAQTQRQPPNALAYYALGRLEGGRKDYTAAIENYRLCLKDLPEFDLGLLMFVSAYSEMGKLAEAKPYLDALLEARPASPTPHLGLGYYLIKQRQPDAAIKELNRALALNTRTSYPCYYKIYTWFYERRFGKALEELEQCERVFAAETDNERSKGNYILAGYIYREAGNDAAAVNSFAQALKLAQETGDLVTEEAFHDQVGVLYARQGQYSQALASFQRAFELANENRNEEHAARSLGNIGGVYESLGDATSAFQHYEAALKMSEKVGDQTNQSHRLMDIGGLLVTEGKFDQAISQYESALMIARKLSNRALLTTILNSLAVLHIHTRDLPKAEEALRRAQQLAQETSSPEDELVTLNNFGDLYRAKGEWALAAELYGHALQIATALNRPEHIWKAQAGLAATDERQTRLSQAREHYQLAIEAMEDVRAKLGGEEERAGFFQDKIAVYKKHIALLLDLHARNTNAGYDAQAFHYTERAHARAFLDLLAEAKVNVEQSGAPDLAKRQQELQQRISQLTAQLIQERSKEISKQDPAKIIELEKSFGQADAELGDWVRELRRRNPRYAALKYPEPVSLAEAQRTLDYKTVLLSYSLAEPVSFVFAITRDDFQVKRLSSEAAIGDVVKKLLAAVTDKNHPAPEEYRRQAVRLSQQLLQPVSRMLAGKNALVIVADGALHRLPFEVLLLPGAPAQGDLRRLPYLIRRYAISYAPSASVFAELQSEPRETAPKGFIGFGDPIYEPRDESAIASALRAANAGRLTFQRLSHSRDEVEGIAKLFNNDDRDIFLGEAASEENVKAPDRLSRYRIVHFSTHGYVNEVRPRFSGLVLSLPSNNSPGAATPQSTINRQSEDGLLSAYEIFNLKLKADLVVLSACETGLGKEIKGEGLMSLMRAFMYAGTPSVVVSLWNVNDESAADLMIRFYRHLKTGRGSKAEALRQAQLETIRDNGFPFFWAPFVLVGKP